MECGAALLWSLASYESGRTPVSGGSHSRDTNLRDVWSMRKFVTGPGGPSKASERGGGGASGAFALGSFGSDLGSAASTSLGSLLGVGGCVYCRHGSRRVRTASISSEFPAGAPWFSSKRVEGSGHTNCWRRCAWRTLACETPVGSPNFEGITAGDGASRLGPCTPRPQSAAKSLEIRAAQLFTGSLGVEAPHPILPQRIVTSLDCP